MMLFCFLAVYLFFLYVPLKQAMHMFQQNRYNRGRLSGVAAFLYPDFLENDGSDISNAAAELWTFLPAADFHAGGTAAYAGHNFCLYQQ